MKIVALDISGNFKEGKGTTGIAELIDGEVRCISSLSAKHHSSPEEYWHEVIRDTIFRQPNVVVIEGYMLYNHKGMNASTQANSDLETPQLLGALKHYLYLQKSLFTFNMQKILKQDGLKKILVHMGILTEKSTSNKSKLYLFKNQITSTHERDAMKHALRFGITYMRKESGSHESKTTFQKKLTDAQIKELTEKAAYEGMHIGIKSAWETMLERRSVLKTVLDAKSYREVNRIMFPEQPIEEEDNA